MVEVNCPSCRESMGIEENEPHTEWECPTCGAAFRMHKSNDGSLQFTIVQSAPALSSAIQPESAPMKAPSRRRRNRATIPAPQEDDPDLNVSLAPTLPLQDRFPDLQPGQPPSLFTYNGVGFMLYGSRDFDPPTGTYVSSACFTIFFVPIFIIAAYRVADAPAQGWFSNSSWHVLGKVPLSPLAKGWNWTVCALIVLFIFNSPQDS